MVDFSTDFEGLFELVLNEVLLELHPFSLLFDGVSDISNVMSRFLTYTGNVLLNRVVSINKYLGPAKIGKAVNSLISMVPDEIDIPGTTLFVEGGISKNFTIKEHNYTAVSFDLSLHNRSRVSNITNPVDFSQHDFDGYQVQTLLSDYFLRSIIDSIYNPGINFLSAEMPFTTTSLNYILLGSMTKHGWEKDMPCTMDFIITGDMPQAFITQKEGLHLETMLAFDLKCQKNKTDEEFYQVFTILTKPIKVTSKIELSDDFVIKLHLSDFQINVDTITDSKVGNFYTLEIIKLIVDLVEGTAKTLINAVMKRGFSVEWLLKKLKIDFIGLEKTLLQPFDGYFLFYFTPFFNLDVPALTEEVSS
jgi:hypothetical protein